MTIEIVERGYYATNYSFDLTEEKFWDIAHDLNERAGKELITSIPTAAQIQDIMNGNYDSYPALSEKIEMEYMIAGDLLAAWLCEEVYDCGTVVDDDRQCDHSEVYVYEVTDE